MLWFYTGFGELSSCGDGLCEGHDVPGGGWVASADLYCKDSAAWSKKVRYNLESEGLKKDEQNQ